MPATGRLCSLNAKKILLHSSDANKWCNIKPKQKSQYFINAKVSLTLGKKRNENHSLNTEIHLSVVGKLSNIDSLFTNFIPVPNFSIYYRLVVRFSE